MTFGYFGVYFFWAKIITVSSEYTKTFAKTNRRDFFFFLIKLLTDSDRFADAFLSNKLNLPSRSRANRTDIRSFNHLFPDYPLTIYTA